jgi:siderophore ferric iron reductase
MSSSLPGIIASVARCQPALAGRIGPARPDEIVPGGDPAPLSALIGWWRTRYPEAGPLYWASRCWTLIVWQPLYLAVWAVHAAGAVPRLASLAQHVDGGMVAGYALDPHLPEALQESVAIRRAGAEARALTDRLYADLAAQLRLHPKMARRLLADCLLAGVLAVARTRPAWSAGLTRALGEAWLEACDLSGQSGYLSFSLPGGGSGLGLARQVCCQHFRRADGELCASCPRLDAGERLARLQREWRG